MKKYCRIFFFLPSIVPLLFSCNGSKKPAIVESNEDSTTYTINYRENNKEDTVSIVVVEQPDSLISKKITGEWMLSEGQGSLTFRSDGSYIVVMFDGSQCADYAGNWSIEAHSQIVLTQSDAIAIGKNCFYEKEKTLLFKDNGPSSPCPLLDEEGLPLCFIQY